MPLSFQWYLRRAPAPHGAGRRSRHWPTGAERDTREAVRRGTSAKVVVVCVSAGPVVIGAELVDALNGPWPAGSAGAFVQDPCIVICGCVQLNTNQNRKF